LLKILLVTHYFPAHRGGVEIVAGKLIENLLRNPNISAVWIASNTDTCPSSSLRLTCCPVSTLNLFENNLQIPYPIWMFSAFTRILKEVKSSDIIHLHDYLYMGNIITFILAKIYRKPIVITQHIGLIPYKSIFLRNLLALLNRTIGSFMLGSAKQVIFISEEVKIYFTKHTTFAHLPLLIANGVESNIFYSVSSKERLQLRLNYGFTSEATIYLFVGRFVEKKGLPILKQLAQRFPQIHWVFAGWGKLDPEEWNLSNVRVFKGLANTELTPLYQISDLLILPSKGEGFPLVVQEAMACGTPTMVSAEVAQAYPLAKSLMIPVEVETSDAIAQWAEKIKFLLANFNIVSELRPKVAEFAIEHWSWRNCAEKYQETLEIYTKNKKLK
jgi:glycosyltransferase involved in cell wall biosynthesis